MNAAPSTTEDTSDLRAACVLLRDRIREGEPTRVEDLLEIYPSLARSDEAVFELIHTEISTRNERGHRPTLDEWHSRFPALLRRREITDSLRAIFGTEMHTLSDSPPPGQVVSSTSVAGSLARLPRVGNYQLIQEIGRGGMGVVYKARQTGLSRVVALKMILAGEHAGLRERARLRNEAEAAAQLLHPNVVQIFEIGEHEGLPFLAMEFVSGGNLLSMLRGMPQAFRWSARLTESLARTIHVAHQRGIIHRDLNPSNILMTTDGTPKITDFGLAKFLVDDAGVSLNGVILGTPSYMAPEQVTPHPEGIGPGTDVYALGALLYEMLTGTAPFRGLTPMETMCQVVEAEVVSPSRLRHGVPEDLETICLKCLEKQPGARYGSAKELADDLRRFQDSEPILARRATRLRQLLHWSRRQPLVAGLLSLSVLLLVALLSLIGGYLAVKRTVELQGRSASDRITREKLINEIIKQRLDGAVKNSGLRLRYTHLLGQIKQCWESGQFDLAQELLGKMPPEVVRGFEYSYLERLVSGSLSRFEAHSEPVTCLAVGEGTLMASGDRSGLVIAWDLPKGIPHRSQGRHDHAVRHVAVSESRSGSGPGAVASVSVGEDGSIDLKLWNAATCALLHSSRAERLDELQLAFSSSGDVLTLVGVAPDTRQIRCLRWRSGPSGWGPLDASGFSGGSPWSASPDGRLVALAQADGSIRLEQAGGGKAPALERSGGVGAVSIKFSKDSKRLVAARGDGSTTLWDIADGRVLARDDGAGKRGVVLGLMNNGSEAIGTDGPGAFWVRKIGEAAPACRLSGLSGTVGSVVLSRDGGLLAAEIDQQRVTVWKLSTGESLGSFLGTRGPIHRIAFAADGQSLIIGSADPAIRLWRFQSSDDLADPLPGHRAAVHALAFSHDDRLLATGSEDHSIKLWRVEDGRELGTLTRHEGAVTSLVFLPDGRLISAGMDGQAILWQLQEGQGDSDSLSAAPETIRRGDEPCLSLGVPTLPDAAEVAIGGDSGTIWILDLATRKQKFELKKHAAGVRSIVYCGQSAFASASLDGTVTVWDGHSEMPYTTKTFTSPMRAIAFLPEGEELAATGDSREVVLWSIYSVERKMTLSAHPLPSRCIAFPQAGRVLATACDDGRIRLWDTVAGLQIYSLNGHRRPINAIAFSGDGDTLASADNAGRINLWRSMPTDR